MNRPKKAIEQNVNMLVRRILQHADLLQDHVALDLDLVRIEDRVQHDVRDHVHGKANVLGQDAGELRLEAGAADLDRRVGYLRIGSFRARDAEEDGERLGREPVLARALDAFADVDVTELMGNEIFVYLNFSAPTDMYFIVYEGDNVTGVELRVHDLDTSYELARRIEQTLGGAFHSLDWSELNRNLFTALEVQKIALTLVIATIIFVAAFNVIATLIMIVLEKKREIAILKAMGATDGTVLRVFMLQGIVVGIIGTLIGVLVGGGIVTYLDEGTERYDALREARHVR